MSADSRRPVLVGVSQLLQRGDDLESNLEPLALMSQAVKAAAEDAGNPALISRAASLRVVRGVWPYGDPARIVAREVGCPDAETVVTCYGGNSVQSLINASCLEIQGGAMDVVILTGAECGRSFARARKACVDLGWTHDGKTPDRVFGEDVALGHPAEIARDIKAPIQIYPVFEIALRHERKQGVEEHLKSLSELWADFSRVASDNPSAWIREQRSAEEIRTPGPGNKPISFPYPLLMNSNDRVDMGCALILCNEGTARELGIPREKWVYPHAGTDSHDTYAVSERDSLSGSPAIRIAGRRALDLAGVAASDLAHVDLYSCFPSAVQVAAKELGFPERRPLTVTGGLTFGGGPMNNYVMHGVARMVEVLREDPGRPGLCSANGGFLTKHAFVVYSTEPGEQPFRYEDVQAEVDALPTRKAVVDHDGEVEIEAYSVMYEGDTPAVAHVACRLPDGSRSWANANDRDLALEMTQQEFCGRAGRIDGQGGLTLR